jgi:hypothetical protein
VYFVVKTSQSTRRRRSGVEWEEYVESTKPRAEKEEGYNTCWICKTKHISVLTEAMAKMKFAKKLEDSSIFKELRRTEYTFTAQPKTGFCKELRTSEYFWYPDLEAAALAAGWKLAENKRNRKKITSTVAATVTPGSSTKKSKPKCETCT